MFNFMMKKMMQRQMKNVPKDQQEKIMAMVEKDPKFFSEIAKEIKVKMDGGMDQQTASMKVMMNHQARIKELMGE